MEYLLCAGRQLSSIMRVKKQNRKKEKKSFVIFILVCKNGAFTNHVPVKPIIPVVSQSKY